MNDAGSFPQQAWHCPCFDRFRIREWEDESFLFNPASGDTHLLNTLSMEILRILKLNKLSADALVNTLAGNFGSDEPPLLQDNLIAYLQLFESMGLIVSCQACG